MSFERVDAPCLVPEFESGIMGNFGGCFKFGQVLVMQVAWFFAFKAHEGVVNGEEDSIFFIIVF